MVALSWEVGLVRRRPGRLAGAAAGVALAVALLGSIAAFLTAAKATMTARAIAGVTIDWQVEAQPGADPTAMVAAVRSDPHVQSVATVGFGDTTGFEATIAGTTQTTGPGKVLGLPAHYLTQFPGAVRSLAGATTGVLLTQQTAANLHAAPGDEVGIGLAGSPAVTFRVDGVVDLPQADSLFQHVGAPTGSQATAPPDNVVLLPADAWHAIYDPVSAVRPDLVHVQAHAALGPSFPHDPAAAFNEVVTAANHLEANLSGGGLVGDNVGAALDAARKDALYAQILFFLLGAPGAVLAALLTRAVVAAGAPRRRREYALLRVRGASVRALERLALAEAGVVAVVGGMLGLAVAALLGRAVFGSATFGAGTRAAVEWGAAAFAAGVLVAVATVALPARREARLLTVASQRRAVGRPGRPRLLRWGLDVWLLAVAGLVIWATARTKYALVLAPEGVAALSLSYWALAGPVLLWAGAGLLAWRLVDVVLDRGAGAVRAAIRPVATGLAAPISASLRRQRRSIAATAVLVGLSLAFAISTAVFNATYRQQTRADALLTNGADVTVTAVTAAADLGPRLARVHGVRHVETIQHRFVYVGADLQDLYGVDPATILDATRLQDAYFSGGTASELMRTLSRRPDAALVSAETVHDFQLQPGDELRLRVRDARTGDLVPVTFHYAGVVKEFPTAPTDSFVVANAGYIAAHAGGRGAETFLLDTRGASPSMVAARVKTVVGGDAVVTDLDTSRRVIGSSLTAVDLAGLTRIELGFALLLTASSSGVMLALGFAERRRSFAIVTALGARARQLGAFVRAEAVVVTVLGAVAGVVTGWVVALTLVKVLTGVFDPPPSALAIPWRYLATVGGLAIVAVVVAVEITIRLARHSTVERLRDL